MAGNPAVQVRGAKELRKALKDMGGDLKDLTRLHKRAADKVAHKARELVPIQSGTLAKSIKSKATRSSGRVLAGGRLIPYAGVIHYGWPAHNINAQPFLTDALEQERADVIGVYEVGIEDMVRALDRKTPG